MKLKNILPLMALAISFGAIAQSYDDDIYYNPKNDKSANTSKRNPYYVEDMSQVDIDAYNRRGEQYYTTPIDTIGYAISNGEDFMYTQEIQKFYNPTIIVDNAGQLREVLDNSYGNVNIVIEDSGYPVFYPWYATSYYPYYSYSPYYYGYYSPFNPYWGIGYYDPWFSWNWGFSWGWGPSWSWGPGWGWGWGPSWSWGPGWGGYPYPGGSWANHNSHGNNVTRPAQGWASNTRPGYTSASAPHRGSGNQAMNRPMGSASSSMNPSSFNGGHRQSSGSVNIGNFRGDATSDRYSATNRNNNRYNGTTNSSSNRYNGTTSSGNRYNSGTSTSSGNRNNNSSYQRGNSTTRSTGSFNSGSSSSSSRSSGGGMSRGSGGGGGSRGGGGGGGHRR